MPFLIPEILFAIGKKLIENGDSEEAIMKFALSGKESLNILKNVFASVTTLKLFDNHFAIGWGKNYSKFAIDEFPKSLVYCIGGSVKKLRIENGVNPFFQPIIDKIIERKKLISFSSSCTSYRTEHLLFLKTFLPIFSTTLKELLIPNQAMSGILLDELRPETLTFLNGCNRGLYFMLRPFPKVDKFSPFSTSVKRLEFMDKSGRVQSSLKNYLSIIQLFPSLKTVCFNIKFEDLHSFQQDVQELIKIIREKQFAFKIVYTLFLRAMANRTVKWLQNGICKKFKYHAFNPRIHGFSASFRKKGILPSPDSQVLCVLIHEKKSDA